MIDRQPPLIIGLGHRHRRDDAVGPVVAEALAARGLDARVHEGDGLALMDLWQGRDHCIVVDALFGAAPPGAVLHLPGEPKALGKAGFVHSSHRIGLPEAVALGQALGRLPDRLEVIGIAGGDFGFGRELSPEVQRAAESVIADLSPASAPSPRSRAALPSG